MYRVVKPSLAIPAQCHGVERPGAPIGPQRLESGETNETAMSMRSRFGSRSRSIRRGSNRPSAEPSSSTGAPPLRSGKSNWVGRSAGGIESRADGSAAITPVDSTRPRTRHPAEPFGCAGGSRRGTSRGRPTRRTRRTRGGRATSAKATTQTRLRRTMNSCLSQGGSRIRPAGVGGSRHAIDSSDADDELHRRGTS